MRVAGVHFSFLVEALDTPSLTACFLSSSSFCALSVCLGHHVQWFYSIPKSVAKLGESVRAMASIDVPQQLTLTCKSEFPEYVSTEEGTCWALLSTQAPPYVDESTTRAPLDLVAVVDKSGSMRNEKIRMVRETLKFVVDQSKSCSFVIGKY